MPVAIEIQCEVKKRVYLEAKAKYKRAGARYGKAKTLVNLERYHAAKAEYQKKGEALRSINQRARV